MLLKEKHTHQPCQKSFEQQDQSACNKICYNCDTKFVAVKPTPWDGIYTQLDWQRTQEQIAQGPRAKPNTIVYLNEQVNYSILLYCLDHSLAQPSLENFPSAADGNKHRDPQTDRQTDIVRQRLSEAEIGTKILEHSVLSGIPLSNHSPPSLGNHSEIRQRKNSGKSQGQ